MGIEHTTAWLAARYGRTAIWFAAFLPLAATLTSWKKFVT